MHVLTGAYKSATTGLRSARTDSGLSVSSIEDTSDAFNEEVKYTITVYFKFVIFFSFFLFFVFTFLSFIL